MRNMRRGKGKRVLASNIRKCKKRKSDDKIDNTSRRNSFIFFASSTKNCFCFSFLCFWFSFFFLLKKKNACYSVFFCGYLRQITLSPDLKNPSGTLAGPRASAPGSVRRRKNKNNMHIFFSR